MPILLLLAALVVPPARAAGASAVYFEQTTVVLQDGRPAGPGVSSRVWYAGRLMRMEAVPSGAALVLRLDENRALRIDPAARRVTALDLEALKMRAHLESAMAGDLMGTTDAAPRTVALRGTRTIAGRPCRGYRISAGSTVMEVWLAGGLGVGIDTFADFLEWSGASVSMAPFLAALRALPGFPLQTRTRVMILGEPQETLSTVTKVRVAEPPPGAFDAPAGFTVEEAR